MDDLPSRGCDIGLDECWPGRDGPKLRVEISTEVDLIATARRYDASSGAIAGDCPVDHPEDNRFYAFGPYLDDIEIEFGSQTRSQAIYAAVGGVPEGRHSYELYVPLVGSEFCCSGGFRAYDLIAEPRTICVMLWGGNMAGMLVNSPSVRIEEAMIREAIARRTALALD